MTEIIKMTEAFDIKKQKNRDYQRIKAKEYYDKISDDKKAQKIGRSLLRNYINNYNKTKNVDMFYINLKMMQMKHPEYYNKIYSYISTQEFRDLYGIDVGHEQILKL
jgi:hypothetical protein